MTPASETGQGTKEQAGVPLVPAPAPLLKQMIDGFAAEPALTAQRFRFLLNAAPHSVLAGLASVLPGSEDTPGGRFVLAMLVRQGLLFQLLVESARDMEGAVALARAAASTRSQIDIAIARELSASSGKLEDDIICRLLEALEAVMQGPDAALLLNPLLRHTSPRVRARTELLVGHAAQKEGPRAGLVLDGFLSDPNPHIRSKAALLIGRANQNGTWALRQFGSPDARVRANAVEGLWRGPAETCRPVFLQAVKDRNCRVAGNAVMGLYLLGDAASVALAVRMAGHPDPAFRATAAWVMGQTGDPRFLTLLGSLLPESQGKLRQNLLRAISRLRQAGARLPQPGLLEVEVAAAESVPGGARRLRVAVEGSGGTDPGHLLPVSFTVVENGNMVWEYAVAESPAPAALLVGWAIPQDGAGTGCVAGAAAAEVAYSGRHRRSADRWALLKYSGEPGKEPDCGAVVPFTSGPLLDAVAGPDAPGGGLVSTLQRLSRGAAQGGGTRHLLVVEDPARPVRDLGDIGATIGVAQAARATVHVVCGPGSSLPRIAQLTGGRTCQVQQAGGVAAACSGILLRLLASYTISYQPALVDRSPHAATTVTVRCDAGTGQAAVAREDGGGGNT